MHYLVCVKQVPDTTTRFQLHEGRLDLSHVKWVINPYDEFAVEEALRLKAADMEKGESSSVRVVSLGPSRAKSALLTALAMGADEGILIETEDHLDSLTAAQIFCQTLKNELSQTDLILCGQQSIDWSFSAFGAMLARLQNWPSVSAVHKMIKKENIFEVYRSLHRGVEDILEVQTPFTVSVSKGINEPRYPSLTGIMKAKSKPLKVLPVPSETKSLLSIESMSLPSKRPAVQWIEGSTQQKVQKLAGILKDKLGEL